MDGGCWQWRRLWGGKLGRNQPQQGADIHSKGLDSCPTLACSVPCLCGSYHFPSMRTGLKNGEMPRRIKRGVLQLGSSKIWGVEKNPVVDMRTGESMYSSTSATCRLL